MWNPFRTNNRNRSSEVALEPVVTEPPASVEEEVEAEPAPPPPQNASVIAARAAVAAVDVADLYTALVKIEQIERGNWMGGNSRTAVFAAFEVPAAIRQAASEAIEAIDKLDRNNYFTSGLPENQAALLARVALLSVSALNGEGATVVLHCPLSDSFYKLEKSIDELDNELVKHDALC